ncbi:MAG: sigma factor [bacterium]
MTAEKIIPFAIERFERVLISYAKEITGDIESARDAVQETFLRLSRQDLVAIEPRLAPWLFCVCRRSGRCRCGRVGLTSFLIRKQPTAVPPHRLRRKPLTETPRHGEKFSVGTPTSSSATAPQSKTSMATRKLG